MEAASLHYFIDCTVIKKHKYSAVLIAPVCVCLHREEGGCIQNISCSCTNHVDYLTVTITDTAR